MDASKQLIDIVKTRPAVWDKNLKSFYTLEENHKIWDSIGRHMVPSTSGTVAFMRFKALADMYAKEYELEQQSTDYKSDWIHFNDLKFLSHEMNWLQRWKINSLKNFVGGEAPDSQKSDVDGEKMYIKQDQKSKEGKRFNTSVEIIEIFSSDDESQGTESKNKPPVLENGFLFSYDSDNSSVYIPKKKSRGLFTVPSIDHWKPSTNYPTKTDPNDESLASQSLIDVAQQPLSVFTYCLDKIPEDLKMKYIAKFLQFAETFLKNSLKRK